MTTFGRFSGDPITQWLTSTPEEHRLMRLVEPFWFEGPDGVRWLAPKDAEIDGASIPRVLWTLVGAPFTGNYRRASIVHDVACGEMSMPHQAVHRMFYYACRADGVGEPKAQIMYAAVDIFGPKWRTREELETLWASGEVPLGAAAAVPPPSAEEQARREAAFETLRQELEAGQVAPSLAALDERIEAELQRSGA